MTERSRSESPMPSRKPSASPAVFLKDPSLVPSFFWSTLTTSRIIFNPRCKFLQMTQKSGELFAQHQTVPSSRMIWIESTNGQI
ncbi:unnamed protein product [Dicrocoelium dendriticum]|nr:unnamed protein product [Dicrocoelium dendriticum]